MSRPPKTRSPSAPLHDSPIVGVRDYRCRAGRGGPAAEEHSDGNNIVLMRRGAFCKHFGRRSVTADVNQAVFFSQGSTYRVSHPADCGDRGTIFAPSPRVLNDIVRELDPADRRPSRTAVPLRHRPLRPAASSGGIANSCDAWRPPIRPPDPLWADVTALQLVADVLEAAFARHGLPRRRRRSGTDADHADRAEAAKTLPRQPAGRAHHARRRRPGRACVAVPPRPRLSAANRRAAPSLPDPAAPPRRARTAGRRRRATSPRWPSSSASPATATSPTPSAASSAARPPTCAATAAGRSAK